MTDLTMLSPTAHDLSGLSLAVLFLVGLLAGVIDTIAGGGGLLTLPALLNAGLPPHVALSTAKAQSLFGLTMAATTFWRKGEVNLPQIAPAMAWSGIGSMLGAMLIAHLDVTFLRNLVVVMLVAIALYTAFGKIGQAENHQPHMQKFWFGVVVGSGLGFYDGFFGPGTGSFWIIAFCSLQAYSLRRAAIEAKFVNWASNFGSFLVFFASGSIAWSVVVVMGIGQLIGARLGAMFVLRQGAKIIRPILVVMSLALTTRLVMTDPESPVRQAVIFAVNWGRHFLGI
ncbi:MAG: TSUP family transporter [Candidatus Symbiobacter sp.]|nr:TSUP family transporter [Candidatus Symbiobacter sp.]